MGNGASRSREPEGEAPLCTRGSDLNKHQHLLEKSESEGMVVATEQTEG